MDVLPYHWSVHTSSHPSIHVSWHLQSNCETEIICGCVKFVHFFPFWLYRVILTRMIILLTRTKHALLEHLFYDAWFIPSPLTDWLTWTKHALLGHLFYDAWFIPSPLTDWLTWTKHALLGHLFYDAWFIPSPLTPYPWSALTRDEPLMQGKPFPTSHTYIV